jgi:hypothetical protein
MIQYAIVAIVVAAAAICVARRIMRTAATQNGCGNGAGCSSKRAGRSMRSGERRELVHLTVEKSPPDDHARTTG